MPIRELTPALLKKAQEELGEVPSRTPEDLKAIKEWLAKQTYINANLDDQWLIAFLRGCKFSLERTKEKLDNYYTAKTFAPEFTMPADPTDKDFLEFFRIGGTLPLIKPVSEDGVQVILMRPGIYDPGKYTIFQSIQLQNMLLEILLLESDNTTVAGIKAVADMKGLNLSYLTQIFTPSTAKKMALCGEKAQPIRQKGAHHMNTPPGIETLFNIFSSFMSEKLKSRIYIHNQNWDELYKHIPKESLPTEFGGDAGPISDLVEYWEAKLISYKDYFIEAKNYKTDESKRPGKPKLAEDLFGIDGSFRSLTVD